MTPFVAADQQTLMLPADQVNIRGDTYVPIPVVWPSKDPGEIVWRALDWSQVLRNLSIGQVWLSFEPIEAVTLLQTEIHGRVTRFKFAGGCDGETVRIAATVSTSDGQVIRRAVLLPIVSVGHGCPPYPPCPPDPPRPPSPCPDEPCLSILEEIYMADCERQPVRILSGGGELQDFSVNPVAIAGTLLATLPRNSNRAYAEVQNQSVTPIQIQIDDGIGQATGKNAPIIALSAAPTVGGQGGGWSTTVVKGRIRIFGTAGSSVTLYEE